MTPISPRSARRLRLHHCISLCVVLSLSSLALSEEFQRGDSNGDGALNIVDATRSLEFLFLGRPSQLPCLDAADANDDGNVNIADALFTLQFLFLSGRQHPAPGNTCGFDPTEDPLHCEFYGSCAQPPPPTILMTPLDLDFGPVGVGVTSPQQIVTITNLGAETLTAFAGGAPFDTQFGASQDCAGGVLPGKSCQYFFTFTPKSTGAFVTTSRSETSAGSFAIKLRGTGVGPSLTVSPLELDFGEVTVGQTSATQTVTIRNSGLARLDAFAGGTPFDTQFGASQNCAGGVDPGESCQYFFTFTPASSGAFATTSNSSTNAGPFVIRLRGSGTQRLVPNRVGMLVTPLELDFGPVGVGTTSPEQKVTIFNKGILALSNFAGGAPFDNQFQALQNCAGGVGRAESCQYTFAFAPTKLGPVESVSNSSTNAGDFSIKLHGTGVGPGLWVTPLDLDFGPVPLGQTSAQQVVTITNTGLAKLTDFAGGAPFDTQFGAFQNCAGGVAPGQSCQYTFSFRPTALGPHDSQSISSTNAGKFTIRLRGLAVPGIPR